MVGHFAKWQAEYEAAGLAVFPVDADTKKPSVSNYLKAGLPAARQWAAKFPDATGVGFACGNRSRLTVLDIDAPDENLLADAMAQFGPSPVVIQTASDKFHVWYRHNGEKRMIRKAMPGQPVDILGGGFALAPPSQSSKGTYQFIQGGLSDLNSLPVMRELDLEHVPALAPISAPHSVSEGMRNTTLWRACMSEARDWASLGQLLDFATALNISFDYPLPAEEVRRVAASAWTKTLADENWFCRGKRVILRHDEIDSLLALGPDATALMLRLRQHNWGRDFVVANAMASAMPDGCWNPKRFAAARRKLIDSGALHEIRPASMHNGPARYRFGSKSPPRG